MQSPRIAIERIEKLNLSRNTKTNNDRGIIAGSNHKVASCDVRKAIHHNCIRGTEANFSALTQEWEEIS
jgi:hypothetical protein